MASRNDLSVIHVGAHIRSAPFSGGRNGDKQNRGELECLRIMTAENGFCVEARFEPDKPPNSQTNKPPYPEPELSVFEDIKGLLAYVTKMLAAQAEYENSEA